MGSKDPRRVLGPEKTVPFSLLQSAPSKSFLENGSRKMGRGPNDARKVFMSVGSVSQAKGSSYVEVGRTKIICAVYGPREVQRSSDFKMSGQVKCEVKFAPFSQSCRKNPQPDSLQKELSRQLKEALEATIILEKFPKSQFDIYLTVIENGGSVLATCITAAGLALCHASIDIYDMIIGTSIVWNEGILYVDPSLHEEECLSVPHKAAETNCGQMTIGVMPNYASGQIALLVHEGELEADLILDGITAAVECAQRVYGVARQAILEHVEEVFEEENEPMSET